MKIVFFTHPDFAKHQSMPRFTNMLARGMEKRGHEIEIWKPEPVFFNYTTNKFLSKWFGYIDQFIIFPGQVRKRINENANTLFVFIDQALGPWVSLVKDRAHVVHCHDFLAQFSALGYIKQNPTSFTGKLYQNYIRRGYTKARNFISVSQKTKNDLISFLDNGFEINEVVYNGLNQSFEPCDANKTKELLNKETGIQLSEGFILHVGGNQWYKNRIGVIKIYNAWRKVTGKSIPLILIGERPSLELTNKSDEYGYAKDVHFLYDKTDEIVRMAYCGASLLLFPSIAEGFGWPIAEAMASGCPVITTNAMPMTEVGGNTGFYIENMPENNADIPQWLTDAAHMVEHVLNLSTADRMQVIANGIENAKRFETEAALNDIEEIYLKINKK